jgi:hypothetical protein
LVTSGKITDGTDVSKVAELLSKSTAFYDADMIAGIINAMLYHRKEHSTVVQEVTAEQVRYVIDLLRNYERKYLYDTKLWLAYFLK